VFRSYSDYRHTLIMLRPYNRNCRHFLIDSVHILDITDNTFIIMNTESTPYDVQILPFPSKPCASLEATSEMRGFVAHSARSWPSEPIIRTTREVERAIQVWDWNLCCVLFALGCSIGSAIWPAKNRRGRLALEEERCPSGSIFVPARRKPTQKRTSEA